MILGYQTGRWSVVHPGLDLGGGSRGSGNAPDRVRGAMLKPKAPYGNPWWRTFHHGLERGSAFGARASGLQQVQRLGFGYRLDTAPYVELAIDVIDVAFHRAHGNDQFSCDLCIRQASGDQAQYLKLALGQGLN